MQHTPGSGAGYGDFDLWRGRSEVMLGGKNTENIKTENTEPLD